MPHLTWNDSLKLGIEIIDTEHEALVAMLNGALAAGGAPKTAQEGTELIDRLLMVVVDHFRHEEEVMALTSYPDFETHRRAHVKLREQARFFKAVLEEEGDPALSRIELAGFLSEWLADHLVQMDLPMAPHIARHVALNGPL